MPHAKNEHSIVLIRGEERTIVPAPEGFNWEKYPEVLPWTDGWVYEYIGTAEGTPHYGRELPPRLWVPHDYTQQAAPGKAVARTGKC